MTGIELVKQYKKWIKMFQKDVEGIPYFVPEWWTWKSKNHQMAFASNNMLSLIDPEWIFVAVKLISGLVMFVSFL